MEKDQSKAREAVSSELQKYIRFQQTGWIMFCCWPVAAIVAAMRNMSMSMIGLIVILIILAAVITFAIGVDGRQRLKERKEQSEQERR